MAERFVWGRALFGVPFQTRTVDGGKSGRILKRDKAESNHEARVVTKNEQKPKMGNRRRGAPGKCYRSTAGDGSGVPDLYDNAHKYVRSDAN